MFCLQWRKKIKVPTCYARASIMTVKSARNQRGEREIGRTFVAKWSADTQTLKKRTRAFRHNADEKTCNINISVIWHFIV